MTHPQPAQPNMQQRLRDAEKAEERIEQATCSTCSCAAKIRRFGKPFCSPHCAAMYVEVEVDD